MATVIPQVSIQDLVFKKSTPDVFGALNAGLQQSREAEQRSALAGQQKLAGQVSQQLLSGNRSPQALAQLMGQNPEMAGKVLNQAGIFNQEGRDELARTAFEIENIPAGAQRNARIQQVAAQLEARGGNPNIALGLLNLPPEEQDRQLQSMQLTAMSAQDRQEIADGNRDFSLKQRQVDLQAANIASQIRHRSVSASQAASNLNFNKDKLEVRKLEQEQTALNNQIKQETNALKRDELRLKVDEKKAQIKQKKLDTKFTAASSVDSINDTILTTDRLLEGKGLEKAAGISSAFFTFPGSDAANFEAILETFKAQQFIQEVDVMRGLGALGEKEGQKLIDAAGSLSLSMGDKVLRKEINRIQGTLKKARARIQKKHTVPVTGSLIKTKLQSISADDMSNMSTEDLQKLLEQ